jgi:hypothetical protein
MRHTVRGPQIAGIAVDHRAARRFRIGVVAAFPVRETAAAEDRVVTGQVFAPMGIHAEYRCQHGIRSPKPEIHEMREAQGQDVARMFGQDLFPDVSRDPVRHRSSVAAPRRARARTVSPVR